MLKLLYLCLAATALSGFKWPIKNKKIAPVLPLATAKIADLPLLDLALLDNARQQPHKKQLKQHLNAIKTLKKQLRNADKSKRKLLLADLFAAQIRLQNHDIILLHTDIEDEQEKLKTQNRLQNTRKSIVKTANSLVPLAKSRKAIAHLLYHKHVARYFLANAATTKRAIVNELARSKYRILPKHLKHKAQLLIAVHYASANKHLLNLRRYQRFDNRSIATVAYLGEAQSLPRHHKRITTALYQASSKAVSLSNKDKHELLVFSVKLWRRASGRKQDWNTPPLKLQNFRELKATRALIERAAISDWYQGNKRRAIAAYYKLARDATVKEYSKQLYKQFLLLSKLHTVEARNSKYFDDALRRLQRDYLAATAKGVKQPLGGLSADYLKKLHVQFVMEELDKSHSKNYQLKNKIQAVEIAKRLVISYPDQRVPVYEKVAGVYTSIKAYDKSAATWMALVKTTDHKNKYLHRAIASQSTYLNYSSKPRFEAKLAIQAAHINDYRKLRGMYRQLDGLQTSPDWNVKAHLGLLLIAADKNSTAAALWDKAIVANSKHKHAKKAAAHLLSWYEIEQRWVSLENISRLLLKRKVNVPMKQGSLRASLAKSLLQQGITAQQQRKYKLAISKFAEYKTFKGAPQLDFVTWQLSRLYKKTEQYRHFFAMLQDYVVNYPRTKHYRQALLEGAHYAGIMAEEEHAIYFYNRFLQDFEGDRDEVGIRSKLVDLHQAKGNYYNAIYELSMLQKSRHLSAAQKTSAAMRAIELEFRHGSIKNATAKVNGIIAAGIASGNQLGRAYYYKVSLTIGKVELEKVAEQDYKQLLLLERQIANASKQTRQKRFFNDALALITLVKARRIAVPEVKEDEVLRSTNIGGYLQQKFASFKLGRDTYLKICKLNRGNICVNALFQLARFGEKYLTNIDKIKIADTLSGSVVDPFNRKKSRMLTSIKNTIRQAHNTSMKMARSGKATPLVADQVTWLAKNALDFQSIGNSNYFQFSK